MKKHKKILTQKVVFFVVLTILLITLVFLKWFSPKKDIKQPIIKPKSVTPSPFQKPEYYGQSTLGSCFSNNDCLISGCNGEICQSKAEEPLNSICVAPDKPLPKQLGYQCQCFAKKCQWVKPN